jgi:hypothetical protein
MFCQTNQPLAVKVVLLFLVFWVVGMFEGYQRTLHIIVQSKFSMAEVTLWSVNSYPHMFRIFWCPLLDRFYFKKFGKSKTYLVPVGLILILLCGWLSTRMDLWLQEKKIAYITWGYFCADMTISIFSIAANTLLLGLFDDDQRTKASFIKTFAITVSYLAAHQIFIPLNSSEWAGFVYDDKNDIEQAKPLLTHKAFFQLVIVLVLPVLVYCSLFTAEKKTSDGASVTLCGVLKFIPKMVSNPNMLQLLGFSFIVRFVVKCLQEVTTYQVLNNGVSSATYSIANTFAYPVRIAVVMLCHKMLKRGFILQVAFFFSLMWLVYDMSQYYLANYLSAGNKDNNRVVAPWLFLNSFLFGFTISGDAFEAYASNIADLKVGGTILVGLITYNNAMGKIATTFSMKLGSMMSFDTCFWLLASCQVVLQIAMYRTTKYLDSISISDYAVFDDGTKESTDEDQEPPYNTAVDHANPRN